MKRREFLAGMAGVAAAAAGARAKEGAKQRPNIVHIMADDLGFGDLGCYGSPLAETPNLDRLAHEGARFTQYYQMAPVCSPSRAAILTGRFPAELDIHCYLGQVGNEKHRETFGSADYLDPKLPTVARLLRDSGYATGHFGKWHLGGEAPREDPALNAPVPADYGFQESRSARSSGPQLPYTPEQLEHPRRHTPEVIADCVVDFIERQAGAPFYAQAWFRIPHTELDPSPEQMDRYENRSPRTVDYRGALAVYYASVTAMDAQIGRILAALEEQDVADHTIVVFTSDNGPENQAFHSSHSFVDRSSGPFRGKKRSLYEGGVRVPLIVRWPGRVEAGRVDDDSVIGGADWLPTACSLAGVDWRTAGEFNGEDVSDMLLKGPRERRNALLWDWRFPIVWTMRPIDVSPGLAIRRGPWKLLMTPEGKRKELYHIPSDPMELDNRLEDKPLIARELSEALRAWHASLPAAPRWGALNLYNWPEESQR
jgi:N-acetylgalactosamine-6-sulfatase